MVRIKNRYLLVHILYPDSPEPNSKSVPGGPAKAPPELVQFHQPSPDDLTPQLFARTIKDQVLLLYGDYGVGLVSSSLHVKYLSPATSTAIVRCSRAHYRLVWAALSFMTELPKTSAHAQPRPCAMQVVRVSGTIKKAEEEAIKRAKAAILRAKREAGEGTTNTLLGILGQAEEDGMQQDGGGRKGVIADSEVSDDDDPDMESDEDG